MKQQLVPGGQLCCPLHSSGNEAAPQAPVPTAEHDVPKSTMAAGSRLPQHMLEGQSSWPSQASDTVLAGHMIWHVVPIPDASVQHRRFCVVSQI